MKKVLSTALALGLVAGVASTAVAYDSFSISGYYNVEGIYVNDRTVLNSFPGDDAASSSWYQHNFRMFPVLKVNDKVTMKSEVRLADDSVWGTTSESVAANRDVDIHKLYMEYDSPLGMVRLGRTPAGAWGTSFVDSAGNADRIMLYSNALPKPFSLVAFLQKTTENDGTLTVAADKDSDYYELGLGYKTDTVTGALAYGYTDNATGKLAANTGQQVNTHRIKGHGKVNIDAIYVESEFDYLFGETDSEVAGAPDVDTDKLAFMLDVGTKMGNLDAGLMYWHLSGDNGDATENSAYGTTGNDFSPLLVAYNTNLSILNPDHMASGSATAADVATGAFAAGQHGIALHANFMVSDKLSLNSALGYVQADKELAGWDDEMGWEIDLGASYKLLDNLTYSANFGYLDTGDFFLGTTTAAATAAQMDTEDIYMVMHSLNMTF
jgi:hypothetical protein